MASKIVHPHFPSPLKFRQKKFDIPCSMVFLAGGLEKQMMLNPTIYRVAGQVPVVMDLWQRCAKAVSRVVEVAC